MRTFNQPKDAAVDRRTFMLNAGGALALLALGPVFASARAQPFTRQYTVQEVIDLILKAGGLSEQPGTVDTLKAGKANQVVTGIVTTMFPTIAVIEEAARRKANFIIAHEPTFYNHRDDTGWVKDNGIVKQKQQLLEKYNMAVWRFHDYCHALRPDAIRYGVVKKAGWLSYDKNEGPMLTLPAQTLKQLVEHLKTSLGTPQVRVIGNPAQRCARVALLPGAWGGQRQVSIAEAEKPDVMIVGEVSEWETAEYMRDAGLLGNATALVVLGHAVSEEPGMEYFVDWLKPKVEGLAVTHIASGNPFVWM